MDTNKYYRFDIVQYSSISDNEIHPRKILKEIK